jgi:diguanylate cyclase (GGDEF)-like protein
MSTATRTRPAPVREPDGPASPTSPGIGWLRELLALHPDCAVAAIDGSSALGDPTALLAQHGIALGRDAVLFGSAFVEFLVPEDAWIVGDIAREASNTGVGTRTVTLRDGPAAELHAVVLQPGSASMVMILVAPLGASLRHQAPSPSIEAWPRVGTLRCDVFGNVTEADEQAAGMLGRARDALVGSPIVGVVHAADREMAIANWVAAKDRRGPVRWRCRVVDAAGSPTWVEITLVNAVDGAGRGEIDIELFDVNAEVGAIEALANERALLELLTETLPVGVAKFDRDGHVEHANEQLYRLLAPARPVHVLRGAIDGSLTSVELSAAFGALLEAGTPAKIDIELVTEAGRRHLEWTLRAVIGHDGEVTGGVLCVADISEAVELRAALEARATTDPLTGCSNRAGTMAALDRMLGASRPDEGVGLLFIDLDRFKSINDVHGHQAGDAVLTVVARRLRAASRRGHVVGRLGGDEFVVIVPQIPSEETAHIVGRRVAAALCGPTSVAGVVIEIEASVGVSWTAGGTANDLLKRADAAMYTAKQQRAAERER